jgi:hypothetical protein
VDELDGIKAGYHEEVLEGEDEVGSILTKDHYAARLKIRFGIRS